MDPHTRPSLRRTCSAWKQSPVMASRFLHIRQLSGQRRSDLLSAPNDRMFGSDIHPSTDYERPSLEWVYKRQRGTGAYIDVMHSAYQSKRTKRGTHPRAAAALIQLLMLSAQASYSILLADVLRIVQGGVLKPHNPPAWCSVHSLHTGRSSNTKETL